MAYDKGIAYDGFDMYNTYPYDEIKGGYVFDNVIKDNEYISLISCGHQHSNNNNQYKRPKHTDNVLF